MVQLSIKTPHEVWSRGNKIFMLPTAAEVVVEIHR